MKPKDPLVGTLHNGTAFVIFGIEVVQIEISMAIALGSKQRCRSDVKINFEKVELYSKRVKKAGTGCFLPAIFCFKGS